MDLLLKSISPASGRDLNEDTLTDESPQFWLKPSQVRMSTPLRPREVMFQSENSSIARWGGMKRIEVKDIKSMTLEHFKLPIEKKTWFEREDNHV